LRALSRHLVKSLLRRTWRRSSSRFSALVSGVGKNALDEAPPRPPQQVARAAASLNVGGMNQPRPPAEPGNRCSIGLSPMVSSRLREARSRPRIDRPRQGPARFPDRAGAEHPGNRNAVIVSLQRWCRGGVRQPGFVTPEALLRILRERKGGTDALGDTGDH
jgi:hypothetical protein